MSGLTQARPLVPESEAGLATGGAGWRGLLWLTLRQHRWLIAGTAAASLLLTGWLFMSIQRIHDLMTQCGGTRCDDASGQAAELLGHGPGVGTTVNIQTTFVLFMPLLFGALWGGPLVAREYEQRTAALAWSQDVGPVRWLFAKLAFLGVLVAVIVTPPTLAAAHIVDDITTATGASRFNETYFQLTAGLPIVVSLAWFVLGVAAGAAFRRTTVALGLVVALFVVRFLLLHQFRPRYMEPLSTVMPFQRKVALGIGPEPYVLRGDGFSSSSVFVDAGGKRYSGDQVMGSWCPPEQLMPPPPASGNGIQRVPEGAEDAFFSCLRGHGLVGQALEYQPGSRIGAFHLIEAGTSVVVLVTSVLVSWWAIRRAKIV
jgi:hypothetical protein